MLEIDKAIIFLKKSKLTMMVIAIDEIKKSLIYYD